MKKSVSVLLMAVALAGCGEPQDTRPGQPVAHRRSAFKEILRVYEPMGVMLRDDEYDAKKFKAAADKLLTLRETPWEYFAPDTLYPPSHAKAEVWSEAAKFAAARKAFIDATDKLAAVAGPSTDRQRVQAAYDAVEEACSDCHKAFKTR